MAKHTVKKRNPQDATLRNIRALKKRVERLEDVLLSAMLEECRGDTTTRKKVR